MENDKMAESFMSICMNTCGSADRLDILEALEARAGKAARCGAEECVPPDTQGAGPAEQTARDAFSSIVNAGTCANLSGGEKLKGYVTFTRQGAYLHKYL